MPLNVVNRRPRRSSGFNGGSAEQVIAMLVKANSMDAMPPIPMISEDKMLYDFINAVTNDIVIYDDDEQTIKFKENVASLKNEFARFIDEGGSITNAIMQYQEWIKECQSIRQVVIAEYKRLKNEVSQEEADAYLVKANKELENDGIPTVNLGSERKRNRAHRDAREAAALKTIEEPNQTKQ